MATSIWRTRLHPGDWTLVWDRAGDLDPTAWRLTSRNNTEATPIPLPWFHVARRGVVIWDQHYHHALRIPAHLRPGAYQLWQGDRRVDNVEVEAKHFRRRVRISPDSRESTIRNAIAAGHDLELSPGLYVLDETWRLTEGATVRGYGAVIQLATPAAFRPADWLTFEGLTFLGDANASVPPVLFGHGHGENVTLRNCTLRHCLVGEFDQPGFLSEDCDFDHAGTGPVGSRTLYLRPKFYGIPPAGNHPWYTFGCHWSAIVDGTWDQTDRGPIFQTTRSDCVGNLVAGAVMDGLSHSQGGCEGIAAENPAGAGFEFSNNIALHTRYRGAAQAYLLWNCRADNNLVRDLESDGGLGVELTGTGGAAQTNNELREMEIRGGRLYLGPSVKGTRFPRGGLGEPTVAVIGHQPTRSSQFHKGTSHFTPFQDDGTDNDAAGVSVAGALPEALTSL